jgi:hypothetical protein
MEAAVQMLRTLMFVLALLVMEEPSVKSMSMNVLRTRVATLPLVLTVSIHSNALAQAASRALYVKSISMNALQRRARTGLPALMGTIHSSAFALLAIRALSAKSTSMNALPILAATERAVSIY